jgi:signal transduction histidine kinase
VLTNAARHSAARNLWIAVRREGDAVRLRAYDDGRGGKAGNGGNGLRGMRERVELAGGELRVATDPGRGFEVTAWLPL